MNRRIKQIIAERQQWVAFGRKTAGSTKTTRPTDAADAALADLLRAHEGRCRALHSEHFNDAPRGREALLPYISTSLT